MPKKGKPLSVFGENLKRLLGGRTHTWLAAEIGVAPSTITQWRSGEAQPRADNLLAVARALKCRIDDLLSGVDADYDDLVKSVRGSLDLTRQSTDVASVSKRQEAIDMGQLTGPQLRVLGVMKDLGKKKQDAIAGLVEDFARGRIRGSTDSRVRRAVQRP